MADLLDILEGEVPGEEGGVVRKLASLPVAHQEDVLMVAGLDDPALQRGQGGGRVRTQVRQALEVQQLPPTTRHPVVVPRLLVSPEVM